MAIPAYIETAALAGAKPRSARRTLHLQVQGTGTSGAEMAVLVHNISATGLLLEGEIALARGEAIDVDLPHAGPTRATVIWSSGALFGCAFDTPISPATLSAAQLRAVVGVAPPAPVAPSPTAAVAESFGARLHRLRTARRLTQMQVAAELGVSEQSISAWEQDKARPKAARMKILARRLGVELADLLGIGESEPLSVVVARARAQVAAAAAISPDKVQIRIEI